MNWYGVYNYSKYLLLEKPRGLDFSRPEESFVQEESLENYYSRTDSSTLKQIWEYLGLQDNDSFLDIGSGKGMVLYYFAKKCTCRVCGIEIFDGLADIARKNMHKLGMADRVEIITIDATRYDGYGEFNCFFMFNPFKFEIANKVLKKIVESYEKNPRYIRVISVQPFFNNLLEEAGFVLEHVVYSKLTGVGAYIFSYGGEKNEKCSFCL